MIIMGKGSQVEIFKTRQGTSACVVRKEIIIKCSVYTASSFCCGLVFLFEVSSGRSYSGDVCVWADGTGQRNFFWMMMTAQKKNKWKEKRDMAFSGMTPSSNNILGALEISGRWEHDLGTCVDFSVFSGFLSCRDKLEE